MKINLYKKYFFSVSLLMLVLFSGCDGSSPVDVNLPNLNYVDLPNCTSGSSDISGCWISEFCATDGDYDLRYLGEFDETNTNPASGNLVSYALVYENNSSCSGNYLGAISLDHVDADNQIDASYEEGLNISCTESTGLISDIDCTTLDITTNSIFNGVSLPEFVGHTSYAFTDSGNRLCFPTLDFNFDSSGSGSIQAQNETITNEEINISNCLTRFIAE